MIKNASYISLNTGYVQRAGENRPKAYQYNHWLNLPNKTKLSDFNMEQQADIIADYFVYQNKNSQLDTILNDFKNNPRNKDLLPDVTDF